MSIFDALLDDTEDFADPVRRQAVAAALRKQNNYGTLGQLMGVQPTQQAGEALQQGAQGSLKLAMAKQQAAKESATAKARQAVEDQRWSQGFDQRERGIEATRINQAASQDNAAAGLELRRLTAENAAAARADAAEARNIASGIKARGEQDKYTGAAGTANDTLNKIADLKVAPGREAATGKSFVRGYVPGTKAWDYRRLAEQLQNSAFMTARESLKGGGHITDFEGKKAEDAVTILGDVRATEEQHQKALSDFEEVVRAVRDRAEFRAKQVGTPQELLDTAIPNRGAPAPAPQVPQGMDAAPIAVYDANGKRVQ